MTPDDALDAARAAAAASEARGETWQGWTAAELAEQRRNEAMGFQRESNPGEAERAARNAAASPVPAGWSGAERADSLAPHILDEAIAHAKRCEEARYEEQERRKRAEEALAQARAELLEALKPSERPVSERARLIYEGAVRLAAADTDPRTGEPRVRSGERCAETYVADAACFFDAAFGTVEDEAASERAAGGNGGAA